MKNKVIEAISRFSLLSGVDEITVALSGGADSMALLYVLSELRGEFDLKLSAAHFNHKIRGEEADRDEAFVREVCAKLGITLYCESADVLSHSKEHHLSTELAARELRYSFLSRVSHEAVATAHTSSDNLETQIFNLSRGTGIKGLCGIPAKRGVFIRPLILCSRADVEKYCYENNIQFVTDSSNLSDDYIRNRIRHNIIPVLKQINPSVEAVASRTSLSLSEDCDFIDECAHSEYVYRSKKDFLDLSDFDQLHPAVAKRVIIRFYNSSLGLTDIDSFHIGKIYDICLNGGKISLPQNYYAVSSDGILKIKSNAEKNANIRFSVNISELENDLFKKEEKVNNLFLKNAIDCDKIVGKLVLRTRLPGDTVRLKNKNCTKTLKKLYNEYSVAPEIRGILPVLSDDKGIVWICGIGVAERVAVTPESLKIKKIEYSKEGV